MKKNVVLVFLTILIMVLIVLSIGCSNEDEAGEGNEQKVEIKDITFGTATPGTTAFITGEAMASVANRQLIDQGYRIMPVTTAGTLEKIRLVNSGELLVASANEDELWNAYAGTGAFEGNPCNELQLLFQAYNINYFFVTREGTNIKTIEDLEGRSVNIGAPGSGAEAVARLVQDALGIEWDEQNLAYADGARALSDGTVEVTLVYTTNGMPGGFVIELDNTVSDLVAIPFTEGHIEKMREINPASSYSFVSDENFENNFEKDVLAYSINVQYFTQKGNLSDDAAYNMIKAIFDNEEQLVHYHTLAQFINKESALTKVVEIPYNEGAKRYWQEVGVWNN